LKNELTELHDKQALINVPEQDIELINKRLKEVDNSTLEDLLDYLNHDKIKITQNIAKKINSDNQSDVINYMSWALSRIDWLISTLSSCIKRTKRTALSTDIK